ncbi:MAG: DUF5686 family protein, partial [Ferruginibacter sp.]
KEEVKDYQVKDSIYLAQKDSFLTKYSVDSLKRRQGKIKPLQFFWGGVNRTHYSTKNSYRWGVDPLLPNIEYNTAEGLVTNVSGYFNKNFRKSKTSLTIRPTLRYGFSNTHLNGWIDATINTRNFDQEGGKLKRYAWNFAGGKRVNQFNKESPITPLINSISTLFYGDNFLKNYENIFGRVGYSQRFESGLRLSAYALYEDRIPLNNTTDYIFTKKYTSRLTPNYPFEIVNQQFNRYQAMLFGFDLSFKPGQRYIQFPYSKVAIGSKYPTFTLNYTKGIKGLLGSDVNFDKWKFTITDDKNLRIAGLMKYKIALGGFLNRKSVFIHDYQHFNGNLTTAASEYVNSFQLASYYANSTNASFYMLGHVEHHFNGLLTNKIPFFNRLNWNLVAGSNAFYVNKNSNYIEVFAGIENILKIFRVDFVAGYRNGGKPLTGIRIGTGGLIGGSIKTSGSGSNRQMTISF